MYSDWTTPRLSEIGAIAAALLWWSVGCGSGTAARNNGGSAGAAAGGGGSSAAGAPAATSGAGQGMGGMTSAGSAGASNGGGGISGGAGGSAGSSSGSGGSGGSGGASGGAPPAGLSFTPPEGITSVALSVNPDGVLLPMKLHNGNAASASLTALTITMGDAFELEDAPTLPVDIAAGQDLALMIRFAPTASATSTFEAQLNAQSPAGMPSAGLFGLAMNAQNSEAAFAQVVQTLGYDVDVGGSTTTLGTGPAPIGDEVPAQRFVKAGAGPVEFRVVARYSPFEAAPFGYYTGAAPNVTRTELGVMSLGPADNVANRTLFPPLDAGAKGSFDPGTEAFGIYAESDSNAASIGDDARFYQEDSLNNDQGNVMPVHRMRVYPLKDRSGTAIPNSYLIGCEEASNSDYQDYVFVISGVSIQD